MIRNAVITKGKAVPQEADNEHEGRRIFYGSPFGVLIIDDKGMTTREIPEGSALPQPLRLKRKYRT